MENVDYSLLRTNKCRVTFTKKDGDERVLVCTTSLKSIPEENHPTGNGHVTKNPKIHRVFDLEISEWRSFDEDSVTKFEVLSPI